MSSSVELSKTRILESDKRLGVDLQLVQPGKARITAANFRRAIVACEVIADFLTIAGAIRVGYFIYFAAAIGKHVRFPLSLIWTAALAFAAVIVLMLDRVGAYRKGNSLLRVRE